jgi:hypothetical protein
MLVFTWNQGLTGLEAEFVPALSSDDEVGAEASRASDLRNEPDFGWR